MHKNIKQALIGVVLVGLLTGCNQEAENITEDNGSNTEVSNEVNRETEKTEVDIEALKQAYEEAKNTDYSGLRAFVDEHIKDVAPEFATDMVMELIDASKKF